MRTEQLDSRKKLLALAVAGGVLLAAAAVGLFVVLGPSGSADSDADTGSTLLLTVWLPIWVVIFIPLLARREKGSVEPTPAKAWALVLAAGVAVLVLVIAYLVLR